MISSVLRVFGRWNGKWIWVMRVDRMIVSVVKFMMGKWRNFIVGKKLIRMRVIVVSEFNRFVCGSVDWI